MECEVGTEVNLGAPPRTQFQPGVQPELLRELHRSRNTLASVKAKAAAGFVKQPELKLSNRAAVFRTFQQSREIISGADRLIEGFGRIAGGSATDATLIPKRSAEELLMSSPQLQVGEYISTSHASW